MIRAVALMIGAVALMIGAVALMIEAVALMIGAVALTIGAVALPKTGVGRLEQSSPADSADMETRLPAAELAGFAARFHRATGESTRKDCRAG